MLNFLVCDQVTGHVTETRRDFPKVTVSFKVGANFKRLVFPNTKGNKHLTVPELQHHDVFPVLTTMQIKL